MDFLPAELIKKKRRGEAHSPEEIAFLVNGYATDEIPDYQISAWLMAICFQGMTPVETATLTKAMRDSGRVLQFQGLKAKAIDKHSTGGVGDKASLILAPIAAAAGVPVPMIAGRGLGHTGGTLDKLESIPGFNVNLSIDEFQKNVAALNLAIMGQTKEICPADKKLYALRDVTGTVDSLPLICGSIMSKKLAEGIEGLVLDVKFGTGAFMKTFEDAERLALLLKDTGEHSGIRVSALLTNMNQPLGRFIGNSLEVKECLEILQGQGFEEDGFDYYSDTRDLSLELAAHMIHMSGKTSSLDEARDKAHDILQSGQALQKFLEICENQGQAQVEKIPFTQNTEEIKATTSGYVSGFDTEKLGVGAIALGAGRKASTDKIDATAGIEVHKKIGQQVTTGDTLFTVYSKDTKNLHQARSVIESAVSLSKEAPQTAPLIAKVMT